MSYMTTLGAISPTANSARRAADIMAALAPPAASGAALVKTEQPAESPKKAAAAMALPFVGGLAGAYFWEDHRWLGFVAGHAVASTAAPLWKGGAERKSALCQLAVEGSAILGSLYWKKHPVAGFFAGLAAGAVLTAFVKGSPARKGYDKLRAEWGK